MKRPLRSISALVLAVLVAGCKHDWSRAEDFAQSIRCGMNEPEIRRLAKELGVADDRIWRQQSYAPNILTVKARELDFVDVLLQGGEAVAVQRGNYIAFTTGMEFGNIRMLCGAAPISHRTLRDFDSGVDRAPRDETSANSGAG